MLGQDLLLASSGAGVGIPMGIGIGLVSGIVIGVFLAAAWSNPNNLLGVFNASKWLVTLPGGWYGGAWVNGKMLQSLDFEAVLPSYVVSLTLTMVAAAVLVMTAFSKWIRHGGQ